MTKQIYISEEGRSIVDRIVKKDPAFNFSKAFLEFLRVTVDAHDNSEEKIIIRHIEDADVKMQEGQREKKFWENELIAYHEREKIMLSEQEKKAKLQMQEAQREMERKAAEEERQLNIKAKRYAYACEYNEQDIYILLKEYFSLPEAERMPKVEDYLESKGLKYDNKLYWSYKGDKK